MNAHLYRTLRALMFASLIAGTMVACKSTGSGEGESPKGDVHVRFQWQESSPTSGVLHATLTKPGGAEEMYSGQFFQITRDSTLETLAPLWHPWYVGWGGWPDWGPDPTISFITHYTGHVVANLAGPDDQRMRCHFQLLRASAGMKGGGKGECQLPTGETIEAEFPPS